ncbi:MAG TPA: hypothetical protein VF046_11240 [Gemmatimonadales bacterium]
MSERMPALLARVQGWFYVLTGVWAIVDIYSFQRVTGPKTDLWLVKTVGVLAIVIGAALIAAARERRLGAPVLIVAIGSPLGLAAIDLIYALGGRISPIYLLDAAAELVIALLWLAAGPRRLAGAAASG